MSSDESKWSCEQCTYLNYRTSIRCTLCRAQRHSVQSSDTVGSPDIYKLAESERAFRAVPAAAANAEASSSLSIAGDQLVKKWSCLNCTYLNFPKSKKCVQCTVPRGKRSDDKNVASEKLSIVTDTSTGAATGQKSSQQSSPLASVPDAASSRKLLHGNGNSPKISVSPQNRGSPSPVGNVLRKGAQSPALSPVASSSSGSQLQQLDSKLVAKKLQKWTCSGCTYENWPKAQKCVMCRSDRYMNSNSPGPSQSSTQRSSPGRAGTQNQSDAPKRQSPPRSPDDARTNDKKRPAAPCETHEQVTEGGSGRKSPRSSVSGDRGSEPSSGDENEASPSASSTSRLSELDRRFLQACRYMPEGSSDYLESYLMAGGDASRNLTIAEATVLNKYGQFSVGDTLYHLAIKFQREDLITVLLAWSDREVQGGASRGIKRVPCLSNPQLATEIRHLVALSLRQRKGEFSSFYFTDLTTFSLPSRIFDLPPLVQDQLFDELLDRDVQKELEEECFVINWCVELTDQMNSRLYALWNRTAGDCLLDSVLQACWGVFDSDNALRQALADSLNDAANLFYPRWRSYEAMTCSALQFELDDEQWARDWDMVLQTAAKPGSALEGAHIFALAHIIRRPIIVYAVRLHKSFRGEDIDFTRFEGIYLPCLWEPSFCWRSPICLGYTRGHFCALVPVEHNETAVLRNQPLGSTRCVYLPMTDFDGKPLPVHFLAPNEFGREQSILRTWLDLCITEGGQLVCKMKLHRPVPIVQQMTDDWLEYYQRLSFLGAGVSPQASRSMVDPGSPSATAATRQASPSLSPLGQRQGKEADGPQD